MQIPFPEDTVTVRGIPSIARRTMFATEDNKDKPLLKCVNFMFTQEGLKGAGCNGRSMVTAKGDDKSTGNVSLLVPAAALEKLAELPGFRTYYGDWTISGPKGFLIPVRSKDGLIQGIKIRLDDADKPSRKYRWLSSRNMPNGTRSYSWIHVTGDATKKRAFLTEGPLKGDVASYLAHDALFVCVGGVNAIHGLKDTLVKLGVTQVVETMDMDQMTNPNVRNAILAMRKEVQAIKGLKYTKYTWNPAYKGVDDYLLSRVAAM